jgi:hypothetical protein
MHNTKLVRLKENLKNILMQFQSERITSDKGILDVQKSGEEIAVGDTVMAVDEEGVESQVENGEYILTDGRILKIADGKIAEIVEPEKEEVEAEEEAPAANEEFSKVCAEKFESYEERERKIYEAVRDQKGVEGWLVEAGDDYVVICIWTGDSEKNYRYPYTVAEDGAIVVGDGEEVKLEAEFVPVEEAPAEEPAIETPVETPADEPEEENFEEVENPTNEEEESDTEGIVELRKEVNELYEMVRNLQAEVEKLKNEPAAEPATEEFAKVNKIGRTGDEKLDRLAKLMGK